MKKRFAFLMALALGAAKSSAQQTDFARIVQPVEMRAKDFSEYLVQLAWMNNPANKTLQSKKNIAEEQVKLAKKDWLNAIGASSGWAKQPVVITKPVYDNTGRFVASIIDTNVSETINAFNMGASLNFGLLASSKNKAEIARANVQIAQNDLDQTKLAIRAETLRRYAAFRMSLEILSARSQVERDSKSAFDLMTQQYRSDEKTFADYNEAATAYHQAVENRIKAEAEQQLAKIALEEMIGLRWEDVSHPMKDK